MKLLKEAVQGGEKRRGTRSTHEEGKEIVQGTPHARDGRQSMRGGGARVFCCGV